MAGKRRNTTKRGWTQSCSNREEGRERGGEMNLVRKIESVEGKMNRQGGTEKRMKIESEGR